MPKEIVRGLYIERFEEFKDRPDLIKIITGVRRFDKSTLPMQFKQRLTDIGEMVVTLNLEDKMK